MGGNVAEERIEATLPSGVKVFKAGNSREEIDAGGSDPELDDLAGCRQILDPKPQVGAQERADRLQNPRCIFARGFDEQIEVFGGAWPGVQSDGVGADDEVLSSNLV